MKSNLSVAIVGPAFRLNVINDWSLVVKILDRLWVHFHFESDWKWDEAWMISFRWVTLDFWSWQIFSRNNCLIKFASNIACISKVWTDCNHSCSTTCRTFSWINIKKIRWSVIVENVVIIWILLVVQCDLYYRLSQNIWRWRVADDLSWVNNCSRHLGQVFKHTEGIIRVINRFIFKRMEVSTLQKNFGASCIWTSVRYKFVDCRPGIVPKE